MTNVETVLDAFNDGALSTTIWNVTGSSFITETGTQLHITGDVSYPFIQSKTHYDLTTCILAVKWDAGTGTATASSQFIISVDDSSSTPNQVILTSAVSGNAWGLQAGGSATVSGTTSGTGLGTSLADGTWIGLGMMGSDSILRAYKSTDGVTWTQFASCTVGGTFTKTACKLRIQAGHFTGSESPTWKTNIDQASVWAATIQPRAKVRVGGAWLEAVPKVRVGGAWVVSHPRSRVSAGWLNSS